MNWLYSDTYTEPTNEELGIKTSLRKTATVIILTVAFWIAVALIVVSFT